MVALDRDLGHDGGGTLNQFPLPMPSLPLPFVVALLLAILLVGIVRSEDEAPANPPFIALIATCAVQSILVGLRWGYGFEQFWFLLPIVAATVPPLVYASFESLVRMERWQVQWWLSAAPAGLVILLIVLWPEAIDIVLVMIYVGYAAALLRLAKHGPDALRLARFDSVAPAYLALVTAAAVLIASALVDLFVLLDFKLLGGQHVTAVIGAANLLNPLLLGLAAKVAARTRVMDEATEPQAILAKMDNIETRAIVERVDDLIRKQELFRDANLNLNRLARRAGLTARRISIAVNRTHNRNVSQYINSYRVAEACRLLKSTEDPVTKIMFDAGFQTKSNFNREFRRVTGVNPITWRAQNTPVNSN
jgi:AraC-like DNA-binding protein